MTVHKEIKAMIHITHTLLLHVIFLSIEYIYMYKFFVIYLAICICECMRELEMKIIERGNLIFEILNFIIIVFSSASYLD